MTKEAKCDYDYRVKLIDDGGNGIGYKIISFTVSYNQYIAKGIVNLKHLIVKFPLCRLIVTIL